MYSTKVSSTPWRRLQNAAFEAKEMDSYIESTKKRRITPQQLKWHEKEDNFDVANVSPHIQDGITHEIEQGDKAEEFIGFKIVPHSIQLKALIWNIPLTDALTRGSQIVTLYCVLDRQSNAGNPVYTDIFSSQEHTLEMPLIANKRRFKFIKNWTFTFNATAMSMDTSDVIHYARQIKHLDWYHEFSKEEAKNWYLLAAILPAGNVPYSSTLRFVWNTAFNKAEAGTCEVSTETRFRWWDT